MSTNIRNTAIVAGVLFAIAVPAHAQNAPIVETVHYQPSKLKTDAGVRALEARVRRAARRVCIAPASEIPLPNCYAPAVKDGLAQADRAVHRSRGSEMASTASITVRDR